MVKVKESTDSMACGDCTFQITMANEVLLKALAKYSMMLDYVTHADETEQLNIEGLINAILLEGMTRRIKELAKKHCFDTQEDFIACMSSCKDGEEVAIEIRCSECNFYKKMHDEILSQIPVPDTQKKLAL
jgi:transcription elongation factor Elf1